MSKKNHERVGRANPVHHISLSRNPELTACGAHLVSDPERNRVTCRKCLSIIGPSWWRLQLERTPGTWIETPTVKKQLWRPKPLSFDKSGRATRWVNVGGIEQ